MARIILSGVFDSITGSLGGSVIQNSYGGLQLRTKVKSKNPQSGYQQAVRNRFAQISYRWKALDSSFKTSWIDATGQPTTGNQLFQSCNINAILVGWEGIAEWTDVTGTRGNDLHHRGSRHLSSDHSSIRKHYNGTNRHPVTD